MPDAPLAELAAARAATPPAEPLQCALDLVAPHLRADRCFLCGRDPAQARGRIAFVWCLDAAVPDPRHDWQDDTGDLPAQASLFRAALAARPSVYVDDVLAAGPEVLNQKFGRTTFGHRALVHAHLVDHGQLWGILQPCVFGHPRHWTAADRADLTPAVPLFLPVVQTHVRGLGKI